MHVPRFRGQARLDPRTRILYAVSGGRRLARPEAHIMGPGHDISMYLCIYVCMYSELHMYLHLEPKLTTDWI